MTSWLACRVVGLLAALGVFALSAQPAAAADDLTDFNAAVERAAAHNRVALGYLRTHNLELAAVELGRMRTAWGDLTGKFGINPPAALRDNRLYIEALIGVPTRAVAASLMLEMGRSDLAANSLQAIRLELSKMRRESGIEILADCILDYNGATANFVAYDEAPPDWSKSETAAEVSRRAAEIEKISRHCDALAGDNLRAQPEFRRLIDGTFASLAFVPKVISDRDNDLLHRLIGELRAFDNLLTFRYG
jgi:hypothetical protein